MYGEQERLKSKPRTDIGVRTLYKLRVHVVHHRRPRGWRLLAAAACRTVWLTPSASRESGPPPPLHSCIGCDNSIYNAFFYIYIYSSPGRRTVPVLNNSRESDGFRVKHTSRRPINRILLGVSIAYTILPTIRRRYVQLQIHKNVRNIPKITVIRSPQRV